MTAENSVTPDKISAKSISRDFHCGNNGAMQVFASIVSSNRRYCYVRRAIKQDR